MAAGQDMHYYDFLLVGKTGMGKSTLGNKLLQVEQITDHAYKIRVFSSQSERVDQRPSNPTSVHWSSRSQQINIDQPVDLAGRARGSRNRSVSLPSILTSITKAMSGSGGAACTAEAGAAASRLSASLEDTRRFLTSDEVDDEHKPLSVTNQCNLLANDETRVRVLDTPGFSDSGTLSAAAGVFISNHEGNLQIMRWITRVQESMDLRVRRVVYFLPVRGFMEKADGVVQGELQVMHHFFGAEIFNCMVVVATNFKMKGEPQQELSKKCMEQTRKVFHTALKCVTEDETINCPIVYIGADDKDVLAKLKDAPVMKDEILKLEFVDDVCARCCIKFRCLGQEKLDIIDSKGSLTPYEESECHPCFVSKYHVGQKIAGGIAHTVTLGIIYIASRVRGRIIWPGFFNSDEICPTCGCSPGSPGCSKVGKKIKVKMPYTRSSGFITVNHSNKL